MENVNNQILAAAIAKHLQNAEFSLNFAEGSQSPECAVIEAIGAIAACRAIAGTYARFADVDAKAFLLACNLKE